MSRLCRYTAVLVLLMLGLAPFTPHAHASSGTFQQYTYNGSAGSRPYYVYTPANYQAGTTVPLIVMLHGCTQNPTDFANGTQMNALADQKQFIVVYPQQTSSYNSSDCWNWFQTADQARGSGEPAIIAGIVQTVKQATSQWSIDPNRVYVAGMSAGAAMSVIMGATYPDIFASIGVESGLEYQAATSLTAASTAQTQGGPNPTQQGQAAYNAMGSVAGVVPTIVFHGTSDYTVYPVNGDQIVQQWMQTDHLASNNTYNASFNSPSTSTNGQVSGGRSYTVQTWNDTNGNEVQEYWKINSMGHAWSGGSSSGSYTDPQGPSATQAMYTFFMNHPQGQAPTVSVSPAGGTYNGSVQVTLTASPTSATIYYTTNGSTPTTSSTTYSGPLTFTQTTTLKAIAVASGRTSTVATQTYTINATGPTITASPSGSTFGGPVSVSLSSNESNTTIHYTTDGSTPTASSATYSAPLRLTQTTTLKYFGVDASNNTSTVQSQVYTITAIQVTASPPAGTYSGPQSVVLSLNMPGTIYYTSDGSTPTTSSTQYSGPIKVTSSETLKFFGKDQVGNSGPVQSQAYTINSPPTHTITLKSIATEDGYIYPNDGIPVGSLAYLQSGSTPLNQAEISILSFDTSQIPAGSTIVSATVTLYRYDPYYYLGDLGSISLDISPTGGFNNNNALEQADYNATSGQTNIGYFNVVPTQTNQATTDTLSQSALAYINLSGHTQFRVHFQLPTSNNNQSDVMDFYSGDSGGAYVPVLSVQYQ
ncbi:hypothetical protein KSC_088750 [Ktedonobacter sp. SOSP1-52]|uniref:extracellular catalytic domain type 1 short-chain-length polyhydroxyalkanoate depolymerase n=1 Tax=Ktedonobacter sp. SOSP1-52 TaxID=2778366 RepID=UPI0019156109|nr:PHB depolymerase family esterase [Ktedonobacter sp. SOSP1-52]GHO69983.1 hypothetical protein KSC_088750 [Ktedonobacter sp. SOSP1-52]